MREDINSSNSQNGAVAAISAAHLLHPGKHFGHPRDVLAADEIGRDEKRAILASWASDIFAIESIPALRLYPGTDKAVSYDEIIEALKTLDRSDRLPGKQDTSSNQDNHRCRRRRVQSHRFGGLGLCSYRKEPVANNHSRYRRLRTCRVPLEDANMIFTVDSLLN